MEWLNDLLNGLWSDLKCAYVYLTIWVNSVALTLISALPYIQENFPAIQDYIQPDFYKNAMGILIVLNIILRFKTKSALRDK